MTLNWSPSLEPKVINVGTPNSKNTRDLVLIWAHLAFALFLLLLSFLLHGRIPGFSADESAALGFLLFFGLGLPILLIAIVICAVSVFSDGKYLGRLAISMIVTFVFTTLNMWTGIVASLAYLAFVFWALLQRHKRPVQSMPDNPNERA
ncbi:MAG: hypothetical protein KJO88_11455 [Gammaproteobacteria bacterium]|nr:hypothetical protein [Gammaproteobacteria bacterium]NNM13100.1 hypothetical protein [Gammaproteobacteria bacterium]